jgi:MEMO1 family protein
MTDIADIRPSPIAGLWYNGDPIALRRQIEGYLSSAKLPSITGAVIGLVAPHAGHRYSGRTAGYAFRCIQGKSIDLVAIVSPMHAYMPANLLTTAHKAYATPLGAVPVDQKILASLTEGLAKNGIPLKTIANDEEHSLEIELPFLQIALAGPFTLLPIMVRSQAPSFLHQLGLAIANVLKERSYLLVASSDLSHFYPEPIANQLDQEMLNRIASFSPEDVLQADQTGTGYACGAPAIATVLWAARELGANQVSILNHSTSADVTGDHSSVVGYGAAVLLKTA